MDSTYFSQRINPCACSIAMILHLTCGIYVFHADLGAEAKYIAESSKINLLLLHLSSIVQYMLASKGNRWKEGHFILVLIALFNKLNLTAVGLDVTDACCFMLSFSTY